MIETPISIPEQPMKKTKQFGKKKQVIIFLLVALLLTASAVGGYLYLKDSNNKCNSHAKRGAYQVDFTKDAAITSLRERNIQAPLILSASWGQLVYEIWDKKKREQVTVPTKGDGDRADTILWPNGAEPWDWTSDDIHHGSGYPDKAILRIANKSKKTTHLLLSAGFDGKLNLRAGQSVGNVDQKTIWAIQKLLGRREGVNKVKFIQKIENGADPYAALKKREKGELIVAFLPTKEIVKAYNKLIRDDSDSKNRVILAAHMTC